MIPTLTKPTFLAIAVLFASQMDSACGDIHRWNVQGEFSSGNGNIEIVANFDPDLVVFNYFGDGTSYAVPHIAPADIYFNGSFLGTLFLDSFSFYEPSTGFVGITPGRQFDWLGAQAPSLGSWTMQSPIQATCVNAYFHRANSVFRFREPWGGGYIEGGYLEIYSIESMTFEHVIPTPGAALILGSVGHIVSRRNRKRAECR